LSDYPPVRLGLIGAGRWGRNYIRTIQQLNHVSLVSVASRNPETKTLVGGNCIVTDDWRQVINPDGVDGVIIATPPALHVPMTREAVTQGLPVLVEKPLTTNLEEAIELRQMVRKLNGFVLVDHTHLFHPAYRALKKIGRTLGPVQEIHGVAGNWGPYRANVSVLWDWGPHDIAMCLDLLGARPVEMTARRLEARQTEAGYGENLLLQLIFPGHITAEIQIGTLMDKARRLVVQYNRQTLVYDDLAKHKLAIHDFAAPEGPGQPIHIPAELPLTNAVKTFTKAIIGGTKDIDSLDLGVDVAAVLSKCEQALKLGDLSH